MIYKNHIEIYKNHIVIYRNHNVILSFFLRLFVFYVNKKYVLSEQKAGFLLTIWMGKLKEKWEKTKRERKNRVFLKKVECLLSFLRC